MDVDTAFLHGEIYRLVYIELLELLYLYEHRCKFVGRLNRSLYGLKQAPFLWCEKLPGVLKSLLYVQTNSDPCVFFRGSSVGQLEFIAVYVDDLMLGAKSADQISTMKKELCSNFSMKVMGVVSHIIGLDVEINSKPMYIHQHSYVETLYVKYIKNESKQTNILISTNTVIDGYREGNEAVECSHFRGLIGCLLYISTSTGPDVVFAVNALSRVMSKPAKQHYQLALRVLRYLFTTREWKLRYEKSGKREDDLALEILCHCDSDYGGCEFSVEEGAVKADMKSTPGFVVKLENCLVFFKSKKQGVVARSSTEAEILAASTAVNYLQFLYNVLHDPFPNLQKASIISNLMIDNANAARAF
jgi:Reverse transcriptase (RNA-dependent DNA polymerase)